MKSKFSWTAVLPSLVIPICLGLIMYLGLMLLIERDVLENDWAVRYLTGHPISKVTLVMFFIGVSSMAMVAWNVWSQFQVEPAITLDTAAPLDFHSESGELEPTRAEAVKLLDGLMDNRSAEVVFSDPASVEPTRVFEDPQTPESRKLSSEKVVRHAVGLARHLVDMPRARHDHYLWKRLYDVLGFIHRTGSAHQIEDEMKYLSDIAGERQQQRYSLVRILIWATPMLGFLGTVLGISQALGGINVGPENDFQQMMGGLSSSLYVAFDTTALALVLSMAMMFCLFIVDRFESQLLGLVDVRAKAEIADHFDLSDQLDQNARSLEKIGQQVLEATHDVVQKQTDLWRKTIGAAEQAWIESLTGANEQVQDGLILAVDESVGTLANYMGQAIERADTAMAHRWKQWQVSLSENARMMSGHQKEIMQQTEAVQKLLTKMSNVGSYQKAIDQNLEALHATSKMQETLSKLSSVMEQMEQRMESQSIAEQETMVAIAEATAKAEAARVEAELAKASQQSTQPHPEPKYEPPTLTIPDFDEEPNILPFNIKVADSNRKAA